MATNTHITTILPNFEDFPTDDTDAFNSILIDINNNAKQVKKELEETPAFKNNSSKDILNIFSIYMGDYLNNYLSDMRTTLESSIQDDSEKGIKINHALIKNVFLNFTMLSECLVKLDSNVAKKNIFEEFIKINGLDKENPFVKSYLLNIKDTKSYVNNVFASIVENRAKGLSLLESIKSYRQSPECRKSLFARTKKSYLSEDQLFEKIMQLLENTKPSQRAEILARIELYIESGHAEKDGILEDFYTNKINASDAFDSIQASMGEKFVSYKLNSSGINSYLTKEGSIGSENIFEVARTGVDAAILGTDNKTLYMCEATTQETGYSQGTRWSDLAIALEKIKNQPTDPLDYKLSVCIPSLFYDLDEGDSVIRKNFLSKFKKEEQSDIIKNWTQLQIVASLDRIGTAYPNSIELLQTINFKCIGNSADDEWNQKTQLPLSEFKSVVLQDWARLASNIKNLDPVESFETKGMTGNIASHPIHLFVAALKGLKTAAVYDKELREHLINAVDNLGEQTVDIAAKFSNVDHMQISFLEVVTSCTTNNFNILEKLSTNAKNLKEEQAKLAQEKQLEIYTKNEAQFLIIKKDIIEFLSKDFLYIMLPAVYSSNQRCIGKNKIDEHEPSGQTWDNIYYYTKTIEAYLDNGEYCDERYEEIRENRGNIYFSELNATTKAHPHAKAFVDIINTMHEYFRAHDKDMENNYKNEYILDFATSILENIKKINRVSNFNSVLNTKEYFRTPELVNNVGAVLSKGLFINTLKKLDSPSKISEGFLNMANLKDDKYKLEDISSFANEEQATLFISAQYFRNVGRIIENFTSKLEEKITNIVSPEETIQFIKNKKII